MTLIARLDSSYRILLVLTKEKTLIWSEIRIITDQSFKITITLLINKTAEIFVKTINEIPL